MAVGKLRWAVRSILVALLLGASLLLARVLGFRLTHRIDDRAALLDRRQLPMFEDYLASLEDESGIDIRFVLVDSVPGGSLEDFAVQQARSLGIGRTLDRRGVLFAYDVSRRRLRIEIGPTLQGIFTDAFVGYLMRHHVRNFFAAGDPNLGLRLTLRLLQSRLRRAALGEEYDPRAAEYIEDRLRLASGGGAAGTMPAGGQEHPYSTGRADTAALQRFGPQPTAEEAYRRYLEWLSEPRLYTDVELFTEPSRAFLATFPATPAYTEDILLGEYGRAYQILVRGDLTLLYFTDDPFLSPHMFRRSEAGWQLDLAAELRDTREYTGWPWTWTLVQQDDDFTRAFIDRYIMLGPMLRVAGGDNRPIPIHGAHVPALASRLGADHPPGVEQLTVTDAAERIAAVKERPAIVLLYSTWDKATRTSFPAILALLRRCEDSGAQVLAFSMDENWNAVRQLPEFLRAAAAPFPPVHLYKWPSGQLTGAMAPLGIRVGTSWMPPLAAVRDRDGRVRAQAEGLVSTGADERLAELAAACDELASPAAQAAIP
jgi:uncharacterized protein